MNCRQAQTYLALAAGQDLEDDSIEPQLRVHLKGCPGCRQQAGHLSEVPAILSEARLSLAQSPRLWPRVSAALAELDRKPQFARFNVWVPSTMAAAACGLLFGVAMLEVNQDSGSLLSRLSPPAVQKRDLFRTDPQFATTRGQFPSEGDVQRWTGKNELPPALREPGLMPTSNPSAPW